MITIPCQGVTNTEQWFDNFIGQLRADQVELETNIASEEKKKMYSSMMSDNLDDFQNLIWKSNTSYHIMRIIIEFMNELKASDCNPLKLALSYCNSKVLVWAEIKDDDESTEDKLIIAEAKVNSRFHMRGFHISTMIMEERDHFRIPPQYHPVVTN
jgi:hypothetical protein